MFTFVAFMFHFVSADICEDICLLTPSCANCPGAHGSYCKSYKDPAVCFGLYFRDASKQSICFQPNDPTCPENLPVPCSLETSTSTESTTITTESETSTETETRPETVLIN